MKKLIRMTTLVLGLGFGLPGSIAHADRDPNRPTDKIAADLGIPEEVFLKCFDPVRPEPNKYPGREKQRANKAILLPCLQKANPTITNEFLDSVMDRYRPEGAFR